MKRSNRLVLLVGVFLAVVAFVGILLLVRTPSEGPATVPTTGPVVVASADIPLSTLILAEQVTVKTVPLTAVTPGAFTDPSQVIGKIARQAVKTGGQVTAATLNGGASGEVTSIDCPATLRCMSIQVDQVSGVGTVIKTGDYVDMVVGLTAEKFPVITVNPADKSITVVSGLNSTSVKLLLQGMQVMGTLLPPQAAPAAGAATPAPSGAPTGPSTALNGQAQIVILAVTAQQAEVLKFAQIDGNVSLALRSPADFIDPTTGAPLLPAAAKTTGITLKVLVDSYGILPPEVVQTVTPTK
ncbi:MAG TPA: Flp pilus assembly protein CpaB [Candidatus Limnocylindrales bacterium]|nr:Flp pilus assembly protein CpaB [Candidatus Limnocylindrales bacterium]